ncbi:MAG: peptidoglycan-binding protein [Tyzzerella sp.]|uniref:Peptidoglycan-binding protein n=1 Tax=Candidatus Fimicola merdigallinarum TaxID=2840819 RepID=A0A9D9DY81_9FIRM|nr:peptidoglycan-binding protein [Candidatus Fimicola merdigallinarum]
MSQARLPFIPEYITVHLGLPDEEAENVTLPFPEYIKNVASSEIYPTWPESAIRANIYAQISYALNRVYTEFYRSQGYDFDITNTTQFDQKFIKDREIFENISQIVDEIFTDYVTRQGSIAPFFTAYCNGTTTVCNGLSQWGTVGLAESGLTPYEILQYYYGDDINIVNDAPISANVPSYPGVPLRLGSAGNEVRILQQELNRISRNYPAIPKIRNINGIFGEDTENAVREFQRVFNLTPDGVVGRATWYRIKYIYNGIKRLNELTSEALTLDEVALPFPLVISEGARGDYVKIIQYYLDFIGYFYDSIPQVAIDGIYGPATRNAVIAFQNFARLPADGIVGNVTWYNLNRAYREILETIPEGYEGNNAVLYPGYFLEEGSTGEYVRLLQEYINAISVYYDEVPQVTVDGSFGPSTRNAVIAIQNIAGLQPNGIVGPVTWNYIARIYSDL